ncbi:MAG: cysteine--tRNA ligase [Propionibacteriaceae bacterium]|nr:cysteine--tRNA ligase [Propionibacteriaceae bacterium]
MHDSALGRQVDLVPLVTGKISVYCCGLTVQAAPHLGHIRKEVVFDVLRRWLTFSGLEVTLVVNVTDIDDKILAKAAAEGRPWFAHAYFYERQLHRATAALGCLPPTYEPRATGHIPEQLELVQELIARGHAYPAADHSGDVYFDVRSWPGYGQLSHQRIADMEPALDADPRGKRDPHDFALWKAAKPDDPATASWASPWGRGRPGWHLECSAMAGKYLGDAFDLHGGGLDLKFPHHENERAQSQAAGRPFAHPWMHNAFVTDPSGEKMSKSLANGMLVSEVVRRFDPRAVRYYLVAPHYRSMVEFSDQAVATAAAGLARLDAFVDRASARLGAVRPWTMGEAPAPQALPAGFARAMDDDLGAPAAIAQLHDSARAGNRALDAGDDPTALTALVQVQNMLSVLGLWKLDPAWPAAGGDLEPVVDGLVSALLEQRQAARARRDFAAADQLRDRLTALGLTIEDAPDGPRWKR